MARKGTVPPMVPIANRPAPLPGIAVLAVPEAVAYAHAAAERRGDQRGRLAPEDIRRDIAAGVLKLGDDAFWVHLQEHPKGGWWVVTQQAIDRRIQERLSRGRGRPPKLPTVEKGEGAQVVPAAEAPAAPTKAAPPAPPIKRSQASGKVVKPATRAPQVDHAPGVIVERGKGHEVVPVTDPERYRTALAAAISEHGNRTMFYVCSRCGWAGPEVNLALVQRDDRGGVAYDRACPECGEIRSLEGALLLVGPVVREIAWIRQQVREEKELTRNDSWKGKMRKRLRELALCRRQAALDEAVMPGVVTQVQALEEEIERLLATSIVLPPVMRTEPIWSDWQTLTAPKVQAVMDDVRPPGYGGAGAILEDALPEAVDRGAPAIAAAIVSGRGGTPSLWPTLERLTEMGVDVWRTPAWERLERALNRVRDLGSDQILQAWSVLVELHSHRRRHEPIDTTAREKMRNDPTFQYRWERSKEGVTVLAWLYEELERALVEEAQRLVKDEVEAEVERLAQLATAEAAKKGKRPIEVAASWCRNGRQITPEMWRLVGYPLAQRLQD